jgi:hypothetical protein
MAACRTESRHPANPFRHNSEGGITNRDIRRGLSPVEADGREVIAGLRRGRFTVSPEDVHHLELSLGQNACRGWILQ